MTTVKGLKEAEESLCYMEDSEEESLYYMENSGTI